MLLNWRDHLYWQRLIQRFVIDEAHWTTQQSKKFRADYLNLKMIRNIFKAVPVLTLTTVITEEVKKEVKNNLILPCEIVFFLNSFNHSKCHYKVKHTKWCKDVIKVITYLLKNKFYNKSSIIYWPIKKKWKF